MSSLLESVSELRPLLATIAGVAGLLFLILHRKVNAFVALLAAALATGIAAGLAPDEVLASVSNGMGGVLGFIAVIVGLGAIMGAYLEASGGVSALAKAILRKRTAKPASIGMGIVGIVVAIPVFFDVGLILLFPLVASLARKTGKPALYFGLPLLAGLGTAHAFVPPTPGPVAVAEILSADIGLVIVCGLAAGIPAMFVAGPLLAWFLDKRDALPFGGVELGPADQPEDEFDHSLAARALMAVLLPIALIVGAAIAQLMDLGGFASRVIAFLGHPFVALMLALGFAALVLRPSDTDQRTRLADTLARALEPTAVILLVTGAGGAFKQVLVDTGAGEMLAAGLLQWGITPIIAGFLLALIVRVAQGSATVAMLTAAGLVAPLAASAGLGPMQLALMTVAIASGASMASHVNDSGFWLVSRYFGLSSGEALRTWTVSSTLIGSVGFLMVLLMTLFI